MKNIRFVNTSPEELKHQIGKYIEESKTKAQEELMLHWMLDINKFGQFFENSFTDWIVQIVWNSREDLEKYLWLSQSNIEDWEEVFLKN